MLFLKKTPIIFLLLVLIFFSSSLKAETKEVLTFEDCVQEAKVHNPDLAAAQQLVNKARYDYRSNYTNFFPQVVGNIGYTAANSAILGPSSVVSPNNQGVQQQLSLGPVLQENLFSGLKNYNELKKGKADLQAAEANLAAVKAQVSYDLKTTFYNLLYTQEQSKLVESIMKRRQQNLKLIDLRFQVGRENKGSFLRSGALSRQAEFDVSQNRLNLQVAMAELAKVLGRTEHSLIVVKGKLITKNPEKDPDFKTLSLNSPSYLEAKYLSNSAHSSTKIARSAALPALDATASFARIRNNWQTDINRWSTGVNLTVPFLNGGKTYYDMKSAKAEYLRTKEVLTSTDNQVTFNLKKTHTDFKNAVENIQVQKQILEASETRAEIARSQYADGLLSYQDWDLIENDLINSQKNLLSSLNNAVITEATWEQAQGKGAIQ